MAEQKLVPLFGDILDKPDLVALQKHQERLRRRMGMAIREHDLIEDGDRILVGLSGGKDSWTLLDLLASLSRRAPVRFEIQAATVDGGFETFDPEPLKRGCEALGIEHIVIPAPIAALMQKQPDSLPCVMCARLRRGVLYSHTRTHAFTKLALGHHMDDLLETLLINLFFEGRLSTMPLKLISDTGNNTVIRPLGTCPEAEILAYATLRRYPIIPSGCPFGGCTTAASRRVQMKELLSRLQENAPDLKHCMLRALGNVKPSHLLDRELLSAFHGKLPRQGR